MHNSSNTSRLIQKQERWVDCFPKNSRKLENERENNNHKKKVQFNPSITRKKIQKKIKKLEKENVKKYLKLRCRILQEAGSSR